MSKRSNGEGNIRQRPNGSWEARVSYIDPENGRRKRVSFYGRTKTEVRSKLKDGVARLEAGTAPKDASITVGQWLAHWRSTTLEASDRKPTTKQMYVRLSKNHLENSSISSVRLDRFRASNVEGLLVELRAKKLADTSVRLIYTVLRQAFDGAVRDGLVSRNPVADVKRPRATPKEAKFLDVSQVGVLLQAVDDSRYATVLKLIAATGLRAGEACGLRWEDVDLDDGTLRVRKTAVILHNRVELLEPKTAKSRRTVPLSGATVAMLRKHKATLAAEKLAAGDQYADLQMVFPTRLGTILSPRNLLRVVDVAAKREGLDGVGVHTLRHSAAVAWLEAGVHIRAVADLLGHSSISITGDVYAHVSESTSRSAVDGLSDALGF